MNIFTFVAASSNSGKTTLIEKVVPLLKAQGLRVAVVKHASKGFDLDRPGKDSWRFREAGADDVLLLSTDRMALLRELRGGPPADIRELLAGADVVLQEGFRLGGTNRIEVFRADVSGAQPLCLHDRSFIALASDRHYDLPVPCFDLNDAGGVADLILQRIAGRTQRPSG